MLNTICVQTHEARVVIFITLKGTEKKLLFLQYPHAIFFNPIEILHAWFLMNNIIFRSNIYIVWVVFDHLIDYHYMHGVYFKPSIYLRKNALIHQNKIIFKLLVIKKKCYTYALKFYCQTFFFPVRLNIHLFTNCRNSFHLAENSTWVLTLDKIIFPLNAKSDSK